MEKYQVFLTKSYSAASVLAKGLMNKEVKRTGFGSADSCEYIPAMFHGSGFFYAFAESVTDCSTPEYELIFA